MSQASKLSLGIVFAVIVALVALHRDEAAPEPRVPSETALPRQAAVRVAQPVGHLSGGPEDGFQQPAMPLPVAMRFSRPADEWQAMLPDPDDVVPCLPDGLCPKARACIEGKCVPCVSDGECGRQELCVLGHCVLEELVECHSRRDCDGEEALCVLTEYDSLDPRGNRGMRSICLEPNGMTPGAEEKMRADLAAQEASIVVVPPSGPTPEDRVLALFREPPAAP
ncbi:hypothetical protein [Nannocystis pusilla]|uniref:hypothetical protein n=1 Tax=Nannocystis pusilla TaxID=889268 RepID=UPI003BF0BFD1